MIRIGLTLFLMLFFSSCAENSKSLFDGKNFSGWSMDVPMHDSIPDAPKPFMVKEGQKKSGVLSKEKIGELKI